MKKKILIFTIIAVFALSVFSIVFATDVVIDLDSNTNNPRSTTNLTDTTTDTSSSDSNNSVDNTIYTSNPSEEISSETNTQEPVITTSVSADEESDGLSITNMINIVLIVVGVVLILLGIAIIIRLK